MYKIEYFFSRPLAVRKRNTKLSSLSRMIAAYFKEEKDDYKSQCECDIRAQNIEVP